VSENSGIKLGRIGIILTVVYFLLISIGIPFLAWLGYITVDSIRLNELGDFLAGVLGPLAIFWLVLGFFQQGKELSLQVRELSLSVEQQKELVEVSRATLDHERKLSSFRENERKFLIQPNFLIDAAGGQIIGGSFFIHRIVIQNTGASVSEVDFSVNPNPIQGAFHRVPYWKTGESNSFSVAFTKNGHASSIQLAISFKDADRSSHSHIFIGKCVEPNSIELRFALHEERSEIQQF
jgi:hypothetical protein